MTPMTPTTTLTKRQQHQWLLNHLDVLIKYWKALGIDSLNLYAEQWNLIWLFSHLFENEKIVCLYF